MRECNAGIYLVESSFLWKALANIRSPNAQGEYYLTDLVEMAAAEGPVAAVEADFGETAGVNDRVELAARARVLQERINTWHMRDGRHPAGPGHHLHRGGRGHRRGHGDRPHGDAVGGARWSAATSPSDRAASCTPPRWPTGRHIKPYSVLEEARVGERCIIGPFARLRPGTELAEDVHLGNFVETKKARHRPRLQGQPPRLPRATRRSAPG